MGLAVKVHKKTRNMEKKLLLCGVTEQKRGLCCLRAVPRKVRVILEMAKNNPTSNFFW